MSQISEHYCQGFGPISGDKPTWLLLGTMPSVKSLEAAFYYAHPRNQFWPIMHSLTGQPIESTQQKIALVQGAGMVLWDVLQACERAGSLDSAIQNPQANDFESLFKQFPTLETVLFNGKKAEQLFKRYVLKQQCLPDNLTFLTLPSTSPANASITTEDKRLFWQEKLVHLL